MKRIILSLSGLVLMCTGFYAVNLRDTLQVDDFSLQEQSINLSIGESSQLHVIPSDAKVRWMTSWNLNDNYVIVDESGFVTALKNGNSIVIVESMDGMISKQCQVTISNQGSIRKDQKSLLPASECEWKETEFSLSNDGVFKAEGAFWGSGAQTNYLKYIVTDQCIFLSFEINYQDSTMAFYPQPFSLEIANCNSQEYRVYMNNRANTVSAQSSFTMRVAKRGSSGTTDTPLIPVGSDNDQLFNLKGQSLQSEPEKGLYISNGVIYSK